MADPNMTDITTPTTAQNLLKSVNNRIADQSAEAASFAGDKVLETATTTGFIKESTITTAELTHLAGLTQNVETNLNAKAPTASPTFTGDVTMPSVKGAVNYSDIVTHQETLINTKNVGSVNANITTITAEEKGDGVNHVTTLTFDNFIVGTPSASNPLAIGNLIYTFPAGAHLYKCLYANIGLTATGDTTGTPEVGVGSVQGSGAIATLNGSTMEDYGVGLAWTVLDGTVEEHGPVGATAGILQGISLSNSSSVKEVYVNAAANWHADITGNLIANGTVTIHWTTLG